jgi:hypothetical protein
LDAARRQGARQAGRARGFPVTVLPTPTADHFLLMAEPGCCQGCVPNNPLAVIEVVADSRCKLGNGACGCSGTWRSRPIPTAGAISCTPPSEARRVAPRRAGGSPLFCLPAPAMAQAPTARRSTSTAMPAI